MSLPRHCASGSSVVCWSGKCGPGSIEIGSLGPINTLPFDQKSSFPESHLSLLTDINKPPIKLEEVSEKVEDHEGQLADAESRIDDLESEDR